MPAVNHKKTGVLIGVQSLCVAILTSDAIDGVVYDTNIHHFPGAIDVGLTSTITDEVLGADDNPTWEILSGLDSIDMALTLASIGKRGEALLLGHKIDANGVMIESSDDAAPWVAVGFKALRSDKSYQYIWFYKGKFKPSDSTYHTRERGAVTWNTPVINATFGPRDFDGAHKASVNTNDEDIGTDVIATFFDTVYTPKAPIAPINPDDPDAL